MDEHSALTLCKAEYSRTGGMVYGEDITIEITDREIVYASYFPWEGIDDYSGEISDEGEFIYPKFGELYAVMTCSAFDISVPVYWGSNSELFGSDQKLGFLSQSEAPFTAGRSDFGVLRALFWAHALGK